MLSSRRWQLLFAAVAVVFFATPLALRAVGVRARDFENRALAPAPELADGWRFFDESTRFLIDRMPLRYQAVHANTWIDLHVWNTTPQYGLNGLGGVQTDQALGFLGAPGQDRVGLARAEPTTPGTTTASGPPATADQVVIGLHGWYFLEGVLQRACSPFDPFAVAAADWEELLKVIRASGRRADLFVAPDKSTIYSEYLSPSTPDLQCGLAGTAALWRVIEAKAAVRAGIVGLRVPLLEAKRSTGPSDPLYFRTDSHWNSLGALTFVEAVLPRFDPRVRVLPSEIVNSGNVKYSGDLLGLLGVSGSEIAPTRTIVRKPHAPVVPGTTVLVGDSYADAALPETQPYFASPIQHLQWVTNTPQQIADGIAASRNVLLETVEREFDYRTISVAYITPTFIAMVRKTLAAHPLH
jgi:hypothetical protein